MKMNSDDPVIMEGEVGKIDGDVVENDGTVA